MEQGPRRLSRECELSLETDNSTGRIHRRRINPVGHPDPVGLERVDCLAVLAIAKWRVKVFTFCSSAVTLSIFTVCLLASALGGGAVYICALGYIRTALPRLFAVETLLLQSPS